MPRDNTDWSCGHDLQASRATHHSAELVLKLSTPKQRRADARTMIDKLLKSTTPQRAAEYRCVNECAQKVPVASDLQAFVSYVAYVNERMCLQHSGSPLCIQKISPS